MATKAAAVEEKIYECEVKRRRVRAAGGYEPFWKVKTVAEALIDGDTEFRCKHCHGEVKLHKRAATQGGGSHVTHKSKSDSEHCCDAVRLLAARGEGVGGAAPAPGSNLNGWGSKGQSSEAEDGGDSCECATSPCLSRTRGPEWRPEAAPALTRKRWRTRTPRDPTGSY